MQITTVLFDLDGTLLPMNQDKFLKAYIGGLGNASVPYGYDSAQMVNAIMKGTASMINNNGQKTNEEAFWDTLADIFGESIRNNYHMYDEFYKTEFQKVKNVCGFSSEAAYVVEMLKEKGVRVALATNPLFPSVATDSRIRWAGLNPMDFELYTTYENSRYSKPNLNYYRELLTKLNVEPGECLMVGNDVADDMVATNLGMKVFLLTDCMINKEGKDISIYPHGSFTELVAYVTNMSEVF